jgi:hypothetical protein
MRPLFAPVHVLLALALLAGGSVHAAELKITVGSGCPYECSEDEAGGCAAS